ncbi:MAG TPA: hypothetical protein VF179_03200 [Thermoanaerobaculia bacterium]|nr:hypothetical protein [Thermoanaerobaculia bacterium]
MEFVARVIAGSYGTVTLRDQFFVQGLRRRRSPSTRKRRSELRWFLLLWAGLLCVSCTCIVPPHPPPLLTDVDIGSPSPFEADAVMQPDGSLRIVFYGPTSAPVVRVQMGNQEQSTAVHAMAEGAGWAVSLPGLSDSGQVIVAVEVPNPPLDAGLLFVEVGWASILSDEPTEIASADGVFSVRFAAGQLPAGTRVAITHLPGALGGNAIAGPYSVSTSVQLTARGLFSPALPRSQPDEIEPLPASARVLRAGSTEGMTFVPVPSTLHAARARVVFQAELPGVFALERGAS